MYEKHAEDQRLLVNYWYAHPLGHVIEGLRYSLGYHEADPDVRVSLLLNGGSPVELATYCDFLDEVYPVPYRDFGAPDGDPHLALREVPRDWDWVVDNHRAFDSGHDAFRGFRAFFDAANGHLRASGSHGVAGAPPPAYMPHQQLRLDLPHDARRAVTGTLAGRTAISVVLAGSSAERALYPSASSWELVLTEISERIPEATFCLIGKSNQDANRSTSRVGESEVERLSRAVPSINCFDLPLAEQLAFVESSQLHISPHTGFSFAASCVGTPWLAISGGRWHEYFFNGVPFHSVLPDPSRYTSFVWGAPLPLVEDTDGDGPRTETMTRARIEADLPEIIESATRLMNNARRLLSAIAAGVWGRSIEGLQLRQPRRGIPVMSERGAKYRYATARVDHSDLAAGRVLYSTPGATAYPVRLADELFQRAAAHLDAERIHVYDPLCGSGYLLTVVGLLHPNRLERISASDLDPDAVELTKKNLRLLTRIGMTARIAQLREYSLAYHKHSHHAGLESAQRLRAELPHDTRSSAWIADATDPGAMQRGLSMGPPDLVLTNVPYGDLTRWSHAASQEAVLDALSNVLAEGAVVALSAAEKPTADHRAFNRVEHWKLGKRYLSVLKRKREAGEDC